MPDKKGKTLEEEVSEDVEEEKETPETPEEETAESKDGEEDEVDQLLAKKVKVPTSKGKEREMTVNDVIDRYGNLEAEFTKGQQILKDPDRLKAYFKSEFGADLSESNPETSETKEELDDDLKEAVEGGKRAGFVHKDDVNTLIERTKMEIYLENLENPRNLADHFPDLEVSNLPEFDKSEIVQYMVEEGFRDPVKAYKDKYDTEIKALERKASGGQKPTFTEKPTSGAVKLPPGKSPGKLSEDESRDLMNSILEGK